MNREQHYAWIRVAFCDGVRPRVWAELYTQFRAAQLTLAEFLQLSRLERERRFQTPAALERALLQHPAQGERVLRMHEILQREEISLIPADDPRYPDPLKQYLELDAPPVLFARGRLALVKHVTLGVAGTRQPSETGRRSAEIHAREIGRNGVTILSGMARGIDQAAHQGALHDPAGTTIMTPACGILALKLNEDFQAALAEGRALILSALPPDQPWQDRYAIERNRLLAALADGLLAAETGLKGGTSHAIRETRRMQKPLWALKFPDENRPDSAAGNASLLSSGALPLAALTEGESANPGEIHALIERLREQHRRRVADVVWPAPEHPEQPELF